MPTTKICSSILEQKNCIENPIRDEEAAGDGGPAVCQEVAPKCQKDRGRGTERVTRVTFALQSRPFEVSRSLSGR